VKSASANLTGLFLDRLGNETERVKVKAANVFLARGQWSSGDLRVKFRLWTLIAYNYILWNVPEKM